jgi:hypothetical protein
MPHIIVVADGRRDPEADAVMLRERISSSDLESQHFAVHLLERLEWAVGDAHEAERTIPRSVTAQSSVQDQRSARVLTTAS